MEVVMQTVMNNKQASAAGVTISAKNTKRQGTVITLKMSVTVKNLSPLVSKMQIRSPGSDSVDPGVPSSDPYKLYYVYTYGALSDICTDPSQAVQEADAGVGVVVNQEGQYIYERGNTDTEAELGNDEIAEAFKAQTLNAADLQSTLGDSGTVMLKYIIRYLLENAPEEMKFFNDFVDKGLIERLEGVAAAKFAHVTYTEAIDLLLKSGEKFDYPVSWGVDLQTEHELGDDPYACLAGGSGEGAG